MFQHVIWSKSNEYSSFYFNSVKKRNGALFPLALSLMKRNFLKNNSQISLARSVFLSMHSMHQQEIINVR